MLQKMGRTDGRTDVRQTVTSRLPLDAASVIKEIKTKLIVCENKTDVS